MALRGTLKDFGIADILQLIGHQGKTGVLTVKNRDQEVVVHFVDGNVVHAESSTRQERDLLGRMLVRAEAIGEEQLRRALETQKRTLKRLGQVLIESGAIERKSLRTFMRLQTTETIYRLFLWNSGSYEFTQREVNADPDSEPIRSESVLMEGFRQVDEWPAIRRKISAYNVTFERAKDLDAQVSAAPADDLGLDDVFADFDLGEAPKPQGLKNIGSNERMVYQLVEPGRDVQKIIDLSRLGEFETCKALATLIDAEIIAAAGSHKGGPSAEATVGGINAGRRATLLPALLRLGLAGALVAVLVYGFRAGVLEPPSWLVVGEPWGYQAQDVESEMSLGQMQRLRNALAVYQALFGSYPKKLSELVQMGLIEPRDLSYPWQQPYHYVASADGYQLLRPLY